jgi:hypothetical protein
VVAAGGDRQLQRLRQPFAVGLAVAGEAEHLPDHLDEALAGRDLGRFAGAELGALLADQKADPPGEDMEALVMRGWRWAATWPPGSTQRWTTSTLRGRCAGR